jgi:putative DNA primase/helicase
LGNLLGAQNVASPTLNTLSSDFGLQSLIGKLLAIVPDARLGARTDKMPIVEIFLNVSGEDWLSVRRKYLPDWTGKLDTRILILSNELPALPDASGALASRYVVFHTPNSFYGREDHGLYPALLGELPGILNWALEGLRRLAVEQRIVTPASARELLSELDALGSPVKAFITERCAFGPDFYVAKDELWNAYCLWHRQTGIVGSPLSKEMFGRTVKTAFPGQVRDYQPRIDGQRPWCWRGVTFAQPLAWAGTAPALAIS